MLLDNIPHDTLLIVNYSCNAAIIAHLNGYKANGYGPSNGLLAAREALAKHYSSSDAPLTSKDVFITSGCSDALNISIGVLCNEGQNILLPMPGFSLYETLASSKGIDCKFYPLLPEQNWQVDLEALEGLIDDNTAAILINNPSNPCGSNYSREHLLEILKTASRHSLPIISEYVSPFVLPCCCHHPSAKDDARCLENDGLFCDDAI